MMSKKKKIILSVCLVLLLGVTVYLNFALADGNLGSGDKTVTTGSFFTTYRSERTTTRDQEMMVLDTIIKNDTLDKTTINDAANKKMAIVALMEQELALENLIQAKGFQDVVVTMSSDSDNINVIVKAEELTQEDVAKIYEVISRETSAKYQNVKIIPVE